LGVATRPRTAITREPTILTRAEVPDFLLSSPVSGAWLTLTRLEGVLRVEVCSKTERVRSREHIAATLCNCAREAIYAPGVIFKDRAFSYAPGPQ